jgi:hypothetical protein
MRKYTPAQYERRMQRLVTQIKDGDKPVYNSSRYGAMVAIKLAPKDTNTLINNIHFKKSMNNQAWILQKNPGKQNPARYGRAKGQPFNYAEAMRHQGVTRSRIRTGSPDYMKLAAKETKDKFKINVVAHVKNIIKITK